MPDDWKVTVDRLRGGGAPIDAPALVAALSRTCGKPRTIRSVRKNLFLIMVEALNGRPALVDLEGRAALIASLDDLSELLSGASLADVLKISAYNKQQKRRLVRNR